MVAQALAAFLILLTFPPEAIALGVASLALVAVYPFAKRFTWWPQVFLGLAFNWGVLLACAAHARGLGLAAGCCSTPPASPGRCSTTRSTPTRTARTTR